MAQEFESQFKPIVDGSDYLSGSEFGQVAGALLARRKKEDKDQAKKSLLASILLESIGVAQRNQKQGVIDAINETNEKYSDVFSTNRAEFDSYGDERAEVEEYEKNKTVYLNNKTTEFINGTDEIVAARVKWEDVDNQPIELRDTMYAAWNKHREELQNKMEALAKDPRVTSVSFEQFNKLAKEEYLTAINLVKNDPTKKSLIAAAWNRIFKTKKDDGGELVTTNTELLDLQEALDTAKTNRNTFRDTIENQVVEKQLYEPLVFKAKPQNKNAIYLEVVPSLQELVRNDSRYKDVDSGFFQEVVDDIINNNPSFNSKQVGEIAYGSLLQGNLDIDVNDYLTKEGIKTANNESLILAFENEENQKEFIGNNPFKLFQIADAYKNVGDEATAQGLLTIYNDVYEDKDIKDFTPTASQKQNNVELIRIKLNAKAHKSLLNDNDALGVLGANIAYAENYYKQLNPNWLDTYTAPEIKEAATNFVLNNMSTNSTEIRMTSADLLYAGFRKENPLALVDEIPMYLEELNKANAGVVEKQNLRNSFIGAIKDPRLELGQDEIQETITKINSYFENTGVSTEDEIEEVDTFPISSDVSIERKENITNEYEEKGLIATHPTRKITYLKNYKQAVNKLDLSKLSISDLGFLYDMSEDEFYNYLGLDRNISLMPFRLQRGENILDNKAFDAIEQKYINQGKNSFQANGLTKGLFYGQNNFRELKNDETINNLFNALKQNILQN